MGRRRLTRRRRCPRCLRRGGRRCPPRGRVPGRMCGSTPPRRGPTTRRRGRRARPRAPRGGGDPWEGACPGGGRSSSPLAWCGGWWVGHSLVTGRRKRSELGEEGGRNRGARRSVTPEKGLEWQAAAQRKEGEENVASCHYKSLI